MIDAERENDLIYLNSHIWDKDVVLCLDDAVRLRDMLNGCLMDVDARKIVEEAAQDIGNTDAQQTQAGSPEGSPKPCAELRGYCRTSGCPLAVGDRCAAPKSVNCVNMKRTASAC